MDANMTIGAVAREAGVPASAIRYYETIGLLPAPARINKRRRYDALTVQRLLVIRFCQQAGFTLTEIHDLFFGFASGTHPSARWEALAHQKMRDVEAQIAQLQAMKQMLREGMHCGCLSMDQCVVWMSGTALGQ